MKKLTVFALAVLIGAASCTKSADSTETSDAESVATLVGDGYGVDLDNSYVSWKAYHKGGFAPRWGTIKLSQGELSVNDGNVVAGNFTIDFGTIWVDTASVTEKDKKAADLESDLKSENFFHVANHPSGTFEITGIKDFDPATETSVVEGANKVVSGNLTLKGVALNVTFPAKITVENGVVNVEAQFTVNRADWGIKFGTDNADPAEWGISKDIDVGVNLTANAN